jgi:hypothetical protein
VNVRAVLGEDEDTVRGTYAEAIRNRMLTIAFKSPFFATFMPRVTRGLPIAVTDLPILGCYLGEETNIPDGDLNAGQIAFITTVRFGWSIMVAETDKEAAEHRLECAYVALRNGLWCSPSLNSLLDTTDYETGEVTIYNARFEGAQRQSARTVWGAFLLDNETPVAEKQWEVTVQYRCVFNPGPFHDLEEVDVTTSFPAHRTPEERERIQQVRQQLLFITQPPAPRKDNAYG